MSTVEYPLCHIRRHAILIPEVGSDIGDSLNGLRVQVVLQASFPSQHGTATIALIDPGDCLLTLFRNR